MDMDNYEGSSTDVRRRPNLPGGHVVSRLLSRWESRDTLKRMFSGGAWLGLEQGLRMLLGLLIGAWVARYLGPEDFGLLSGALAVVSVAGVVAALGMNAVLVRQLATSSPQDTAQIMGTAVILRLLGSSLVWLVCVGVAWSGIWTGPAHVVLLPVAAMALVFQSMDVVERRLQAQGDMRLLVIIRCTAMVGSFGLRVGLILGKAPIEAFALAAVVEAALAAFGLAWLTRRGMGGLGRWEPSFVRARALLKEGLPLVFAGLAIHVQAFGDQIMLAALTDSEELGQYAAALRVVTVFAFLPVIMQMVAAPEIARAKRDDAGLYRRRLHRLYRMAIGSAVVTALPVAILGPQAVVWLFGDAYRAAGALIPLLAMRLFLTNMGVARGVFLSTEGMARFVLITSVAGAVANVGLNFVLIPMWGAQGAIVASLLSFTLTTFGLEWIDPRARANLYLMAAAVLRPWRAVD